MSVELPESIINGRFKYLERPAALPGKCAVCGRVDVPVLDFGLDVDYFGAVVICVDDIRAALQVADLYETSAPAPVVPPLNYLDVEAINEYVTRANASLGALNSILATVSRPSVVDAEPAEELPTLFDAAESESSDVIATEPSVSSSKRPLSVSTDQRDESNVFADL